MKFKTAILALLGVASSQLSTKFNLDIENFLSSKNIVQSLIQSVQQQVHADPGIVQFKQCDDEAGAFTLDVSSTTTTPQPVQKGADLAFNIVGIVNKKVTFKNVHIHVDWNSSPLYDEDHEMDQSYDSDLAYNLGWNMPSFSPAGFYNVTIIATGDSDEKANVKVMCVLSWMDLN